MAEYDRNGIILKIHVKVVEVWTFVQDTVILNVLLVEAGDDGSLMKPWMFYVLPSSCFLEVVPFSGWMDFKFQVSSHFLHLFTSLSPLWMGSGI